MFNPFNLFKLIPTKYIVLALVIFSLVMVSLYLWEKNKHKDTMMAFDKFTNGITTERKVQEAENRLKDIAGRKESNRINHERITLLKQLDLANVDKDQLRAKVETIYEQYKQSQMVLDRTKHNYDERLRIGASSNASQTTQEQPAPEYSGTGQECDATAFRNLIEACQITTIDFNACSAWVDAACEKLGCEE